MGKPRHPVVEAAIAAQLEAADDDPQRRRALAKLALLEARGSKAPHAPDYLAKLATKLGRKG